MDRLSVDFIFSKLNFGQLKGQCIGRTERKSSVQFKSSFFGEL